MRSFTLQPIPPFRLDLTVWGLRRRPVNAMDRWDGETYRRVLVVDGVAVEVAVRQIGAEKTPRLSVEVTGEPAATSMERPIADILTEMLGLDIDLTPFYRQARQDQYLADLTGRFAGFKPPRFPSVFEAMVNGIACQQISITSGLHLLNRLCATWGLECGSQHAFPRPADLAPAQAEDLRKLGLSVRKGQAILDRARSIADRTLVLEELSGMDDDAAVVYLRQLPVIGRWTAQYVLLRGLGRFDVYPADDVGSQNTFRRWQSLGERPDYNAIYRIIDHWHPYRGLIYLHLLLDELDRQGLLK